MTIDVEVLSEMYLVLKEYIPQKDRQEAADNLISVLIDLLGDAELQELGASDSMLLRSLKEYDLSPDDDDLEDDD